MKKDLIVFGTGKIAEVIYYYAKEECGYNVVAFTIDEEHKKADTFLGLPVISFKEIEKKFSPDEFEMFIAVGYHDLNKLRETKYNEALAKGFNLVSIISPKAALPENVKTGRNCFIMPPAIIHPCVEIGNNVFVWSGAMVGHHSVIQDHCWLTSGCNVSGNVNVGKSTFIAVNATIAHGVKIGEKCFLGANSLLTKSIDDKVVIIQESTKPFRLNSEQFLRFSNFSNI